VKKNAFFEDVLTTLSKYFIILVIVVLICIAFSGVRFVKSGEVAMVLRFGKLVGENYEEQIHEPGLLLAFPYIIDEVITVPVGNVLSQTVTTHYTNGNMINLRANGYVITGDQNIAVLSATVKYTIADPIAYALNINDIEAIINACVSNAMVEVSARTAVDDILTSGQQIYAESILKLSQEKLDSANSGITLSTIELTDVSMPAEVRPVYEKVNTATVQAKTLLEEAEQYRAVLIPNAQSQATTTIAAASSAYSMAISNATTDLAEFWGVLDEYNQTPEVVRTRLYSQKISKAISKIGTVKVVRDDESKIIIN